MIFKRKISNYENQRKYKGTYVYIQTHLKFCITKKKQMKNQKKNQWWGEGSCLPHLKEFSPRVFSSEKGQCPQNYTATKHGQGIYKRRNTYAPWILVGGGENSISVIIKNMKKHEAQTMLHISNWQSHLKFICLFSSRI